MVCSSTEDIIMELEDGRSFPDVLTEQAAELIVHEGTKFSSPVQENAGEKPKKLRNSTETEEVALSEEVVEKIIARLPFPYLLKASLLSKSWNLKFSGGRQGSESSLTPLQKEVISVSANWTTYAPVFLSKENIWGFDRASCQWKSIGTLSYLPIEWPCHDDRISSAALVNLASIRCREIYATNSVGSLICFYLDEIDDGFESGSFCVTNVLTRTWREVIAPRDDGDTLGTNAPDHVRLLPGDSETYKVLALYIVDLGPQDLQHHVETHIYDSSSREWSTSLSEDLEYVGRFLDNSAYVDGKLYCMCEGAAEEDPWQIWIYDVASCEEWTSIPRTFAREIVVDGGIFLCGQKIMVVILGKKPTPIALTLIPKNTFKNVIHVFELDPHSLELLRVSKGPPQTVVGVSAHHHWKLQYGSDTDYIYFHTHYPDFPVITYNVHTKGWGSLSSPPCCTSDSADAKGTLMLASAFEPGLNPFAIA